MPREEERGWSYSSMPSLSSMVFRYEDRMVYVSSWSSRR